MITPEQLRDKIEGRVEYEPTTGCWLWSGSGNTHGCGKTETRQGGHQGASGFLGRSSRPDFRMGRRFCISATRLPA